jgi:Putative transmembrane protein (PGPGW)
MTENAPERDPVASPESPAAGDPPADTASPEPTALAVTPPKDLGLMLVSAGVIGVVLPGPGVPALVAGGLILWPEAFGKAERWLQKRFPDTHRKGIGHMNRFLADLERRYPGSTKSDPGRPGPRRS